MTFDTIAFTQDELDNALNLRCTSIGLCDNDFILPQIAGVTYISIGKISAKAKFKKDDMKKHNIIVSDLYRNLHHRYANILLRFLPI